MTAAKWANVERWSGIALIASLLTSVLAFILAWVLRELNVPDPTPSLVFAVAMAAMIAALASNLAWCFVCAISWIRWFRRRSAERK